MFICGFKCLPLSWRIWRFVLNWRKYSLDFNYKLMLRLKLINFQTKYVFRQFRKDSIFLQNNQICTFFLINLQNFDIKFFSTSYLVHTSIIDNANNCIALSAHMLNHPVPLFPIKYCTPSKYIYTFRFQLYFPAPCDEPNFPSINLLFHIEHTKIGTGINNSC